MQNLPFHHIYRLWILIFMNFSTFERLKFSKLTKFPVPKMAKTAKSALLESLKLISGKIWVIEKSWNFRNAWTQLSPFEFPYGWPKDKFRQKSQTKKRSCYERLIYNQVKQLLKKSWGKLSAVWGNERLTWRTLISGGGSFLTLLSYEIIENFLSTLIFFFFTQFWIVFLPKW